MTFGCSSDRVKELAAGDAVHVVHDTTIDCSTIASSATTGAVITIPAGAILTDVFARVGTAFTGVSGTTFQVGVAGNFDKYIDTSDFEPASGSSFMSMTGGSNNDQKTPELVSTATEVQYEYVNYGGATVDGEVLVTVVYVEL